MLTVGSLCSGVGGFDLGFHRAGFRTAWFCEYDAWRRDILARHWPGVPCHPDIATLDPADLQPVDVLIGGTPCQDLSTAGKRAGLAGERSGLFFHFIRIRNALSPKWTVWENVHGALSSNDGLDFASVLGAFVGATVHVPGDGWGGAGLATGPWGSACWRVLDSRWFGVAQRRRRVFVVGYLGGPDAEQVLLEPAGVCGDSPPSYEAGKDTAATLTRGSANGGVSAPGRRQEDDVNLAVGTLQGGSGRRGYRMGADEAGGGNLSWVGALDTVSGGPDDNMAQAGHLVAETLRSHSRPKSNPDGSELVVEDVAHTLRGEGHDASEDGTGRQTLIAFNPTGGALDGWYRVDDVPPTLKVSSGPAVAFSVRGREDGAQLEVEGEPVSPALRTPGGGSSRQAVAHGVTVRRLTPTERERLQGWPDGWTIPEGPSLADAPSGPTRDPDIPDDPLPDSPREAATGDGVTANVAEWIGNRIKLVEESSR